MTEAVATARRELSKGDLSGSPVVCLARRGSAQPPSYLLESFQLETGRMTPPFDARASASSTRLRGHGDG